MKRDYPYLIIGGGMAGDAAVRGIRMIDPDRPIGLVGQETDPPYNRPPLSKGLWKGAPLSRIWRNTHALGVDLHLGRKIIHLDPVQKRAVDDQGDEYTYGRLLLATGGDPIRLSGEHERILYYRTLADYQRLRSLIDQGMQRFAVIGGGFIGSEMAAALTTLGKEVVLIFPEKGIGERALPAEISQYLNQLFRERGVRVLNGHLVRSLQPDESGVTVLTDAGEGLRDEALRVEAVVAGLGIRPNTALAESAGLSTNNGIVVDLAMCTSHPDIFAAGEVVNFFSPVLNQQMRVEHEENANTTGMIAGQGMAGQPGQYDTLPSVYSKLFEISYDAVGDLDPRLEIRYDWEEPFQKGKVYYTREGRVRGVLLWNISRGLDEARQQIIESSRLL